MPSTDDPNNILDNQSGEQAEPTRQRLRLDQIRIDQDVQMRVQINPKVVRAYAARRRAGDSFLPLIVFFDGTVYWLADGFHRLDADREAGLDSVECLVYKGSKEDAMWFALSANKAHGLPRTSADKRKAVKAALRHPRGLTMSDGQIAAHVGVSDRMVAKYREQLTPKNSESDIRTGLDGRTIDTGKIGKSPKKGGAKSKQDKEPEPEVPVASTSAASGPVGQEQIGPRGDDHRPVEQSDEQVDDHKRREIEMEQPDADTKTDEQDDLGSTLEELGGLDDMLWLEPACTEDLSDSIRWLFDDIQQSVAMAMQRKEVAALREGHPMLAILHRLGEMAENVSDWLDSRRTEHSNQDLPGADDHNEVNEPALDDEEEMVECDL